MNEIKVNLENLTETEREQILALIDKANEPKAWKPKEAEKYFFINFIGDIEAVNWCACSFDEKLYSLGNCFKTQKEAELTVEYLKVRANLKRFADEHNEEPIDWNNREQKKYMIRYSYLKNHFSISSYKDIRHAGAIYFTSEKIAQQAVTTIGEEILIKYYFWVGE